MSFRAICTVATTALCLTIFGSQASAQGPLIIAGHDADEHGFEAVYSGLFQEILNNTSNGQSGILAIGADPASIAGTWITNVAGLLGEALTFVNDANITTIEKR